MSTKKLFIAFLIFVCFNHGQLSMGSEHKGRVPGPRRKKEEVFTSCTLLSVNPVVEPLYGKVAAVMEGNNFPRFKLSISPNLGEDGNHEGKLEYSDPEVVPAFNAFLNYSIRLLAQLYKLQEKDLSEYDHIVGLVKDAVVEQANYLTAAFFDFGVQLAVNAYRNGLPLDNLPDIAGHFPDTHLATEK